MATYSEIRRLFESKYDRVMVLGATGFLGNNLIRQLQEMNLQIIIPIRNTHSKEVDYENQDFQFFQSTNEIIEIATIFRPELIINLATYFTRTDSQEDSQKLISSNVELVGLVTEYAWRNNVKFFQAQSAWQSAGGSERNAPTPYFLYKQIAEDIVEWYAMNRGLQAVFLRFFDTYGCNDKRDKLIPRLFSSLEDNEPVNVSGGQQILDLVEVYDAVHCILAASIEISERQNPLTFWCIASNPITLREVVEVLEKVSGKKLQVNWGVVPYREGEVFERWKIEMTTPPTWTAQTSIEQGFRKILKPI
jgi:nucleoside-diphosphate-sugar epimerase